MVAVNGERMRQNLGKEKEGKISAVSQCMGKHGKFNRKEGKGNEKGRKVKREKSKSMSRNLNLKFCLSTLHSSDKY